ncbi:MAG TPA: septum formation initiator family protein [Candidatus Stackebrandtia excrementipullorum]|nr:septum formation initiator family protein [Candidatus Stackebrandtia excrementipullorum]
MSARRGPSGQRPKGGSRPGAGRTRPASERRKTRTAAQKAKPKIRRIRIKPPWRMSGRTAVIALVLSALALSYAYPVRTFLEQRADINELRESQADQTERIAQMEAERAKWEDPEYVRAQARERLLLVKPGEELVIIVDDPEGAAADAGQDPDPTPQDSWYEDLWEGFKESQ